MKGKTIWIINEPASTPDTGVGGRHYYLAKELAKLGHNVYLVAASYTHLLHNPPSLNQSYKVTPIEGFKFVWVKVPHYEGAHSKIRVFNWFWFTWKIRGLVNVISDKPDSILCSSPSPIPFLGARFLSKRYKAQLVFEVRDIWPLTLVELGGYSPSNPFVRLLQWIEDKAYRESNKVVSNLKYSVEHMVSRGMDKSKFSWVPNGFSSDEMTYREKLSDDVIAQLPTDKFIVGYTGSLGLANAMEAFIKSAEILKGETDIAFVLVGNGMEKSRLESLVVEEKINNVYFIDVVGKLQIQSMLEFFDVCYLGLVKSPLFKFGVSPHKLFDYFNAAKPIIYAIESGNYTPVSDVDAGLQVPAEDPESIAEAVLKLYRYPKKIRETMGENGRNYAIENFEYGILAKKLAKELDW